MKPIGDRILVSAIEAEDEVKNGILLPANSQTKYWKVVELGTGIFLPNGDLKEPPFKIGDKVILGSGGAEVRLNDKVFRVVNSGDVLIRVRK